MISLGNNYERRCVSHRILTTCEEIAAERDCWNRIVEDDLDGIPFLTCDWHLNWLEHFAHKTEICFAKFYTDETVLGYAPLVIRPTRFHGLPVRALGFAQNVYSPLAAPVLRRSGAPLALRCLMSKVLPTLRWDIFDGAQMPEELYGFSEISRLAAESRRLSAVENGEANWVLESPLDASSYLRSRSSRIRRAVTRYHKAQACELTFRLVCAMPAASEVRAYLDVYRHSWKAPEFDPLFHPDLMRLAAERGWLRLGFLYLGARPISTQFWLCARQRAYFVKGAYDEHFRHMAPGTVLTWRILQELMADGVRSFDFLRGDDAYKKDWANLRRERKCLLLFAWTPLGLSAFALDRLLLPLVRRISWLDRLKKRIYAARHPDNYSLEARRNTAPKLESQFGLKSSPIPQPQLDSEPTESAVV